MARRLIELFCAIGILLSTLPLLVICAIMIKINSRGPALHRANRVGVKGRCFTMYKFRSMIVDPSLSNRKITIYDDPRITRVGHLLRRTKLDELPQLLNVIKGEMGFVGPRPEDPKYVALYTPEQREVLDVRPGITGVCQVINRNEEEKFRDKEDPEEYYVKVLMPEKISIDIEYNRRRTMLTDLHVLIDTARAIISG